MKIVHITMYAIAMAGSFAMAMAAGTTRQSICENEQQYIRLNGVYTTASSDFVCLQNSTITPCTYYVSNLNPLTYTICTWGQYLDLSGITITQQGRLAANHRKH
ncbi:hypothetical protein SAMN05421788_103100 [Filimonas lacunae]|uniref:Uncharacterized protein n=1 Tax=Filimonas lacunae TaxID=477680 RepID=A0A173MJS9_9BACT|nr:hypothetical protein [Filimonas lacunae]BAV07750.1 hypothetical protein FLA_3781 [Filimonas lacunae]SIT04357.1 hypothetical protein SAMN05421788_103100 [Filimonas lacunae]